MKAFNVQRADPLRSAPERFVGLFGKQPLLALRNMHDAVLQELARPSAGQRAKYTSNSLETALRILDASRREPELVAPTATNEARRSTLFVPGASDQIRVVSPSQILDNAFPCAVASIFWKWFAL